MCYCCCYYCRSYVKCTRCNYSTSCKNMISKHSGTFHPQGRHKKISYKLGPPIILPKPLYCICGFSSRSGNYLGEYTHTHTHTHSSHLAPHPSTRDWSPWPHINDMTQHQKLVYSSHFTSKTLSPLPSTPPDLNLLHPSIHLYHTQSSFLTPHTHSPFSHSLYLYHYTLLVCISTLNHYQWLLFTIFTHLYVFMDEPFI